MAIVARRAPPADVIEALASASAVPVEVWMSWGEQLREEGLREGIARGRHEGRQEGRQEGRLQGRLEGLQGVLSRQLAARFGGLPEGMATELRAASEEQLDRWAERVLTARTIDEVFER